MFSLFPERQEEQDPSQPRPTLVKRFAIPGQVKFHAPLAVLAFALVVVLMYGLHERSVAAHSSAKIAEAAAQLDQLKDARAQISALSAKLDAVMNAQQAAPQPAVVAPPEPSSTRVIRPTGRRSKPDPRWKKVQAQLDAQGKEIEATRQEIASARTDLQDSIARTHEELVVLQKKGERNYFEFDLDKSKNFQRVGPVGMSLRKANTKNQFADLKLLVDDRELSKKHLNLYEPVIFYPSDERTPVEIVINGINKNHIHGYISAAKYGRAELQTSAAAPSQANNAAPSQASNAVPSNNGSGEADVKARQKLQH